MRRGLPELPAVMTVKELAEFLKVHPSTIYRLVKAGQLPGFKVGSDWRFSVEEINRWRTEGKKKPNV